MLSTVPTTFHPGHPGMSTQGYIPMEKKRSKAEQAPSGHHRRSSSRGGKGEAHGHRQAITSQLTRITMLHNIWRSKSERPPYYCFSNNLVIEYVRGIYETEAGQLANSHNTSWAFRTSYVLSSLTRKAKAGKASPPAMVFTLASWQSLSPSRHAHFNQGLTFSLMLGLKNLLQLSPLFC